jgi:cobalt-precorrin-5B (C1)-methyltransferase
MISQGGLNSESKSEHEDNELELTAIEEQLPKEIVEKRRKGILRTGYTTGTSAAAATKAALHAILFGNFVNEVTVLLPKERIATLRVAWTKLQAGQSATSAVINDGGDDPDVTHGAEICSSVSITADCGEVIIDGGVGVGRVTKPGLGLNIGEAAINPTPRKMIKQNINDMAHELKLKNMGVKIIITVPKGEEIAKKTDNPRLGIVGGISILGTTGIVFPYSTASFAASIRQSLDVVKALGTQTVILTTGGRSEDLARKLFGTSVPDHGFIQMGDFAGYTIKQCVNKNISKAIICAFIGKLTKLAMGVRQTHVKGSHVDMKFMASIAEECKLPQSVIEEIKYANTARHVMEIVKTNSCTRFFNLICKKVYDHMYEYSQGKLVIAVIMFDFGGNVCGKYSAL